MAKDAKGHGSDSRGGLAGGGHSGVFGQRGELERIVPGTKFAQRSYPPDVAKTIADLRARMSGTGDGHATALRQGIRNMEGASAPGTRGR